MTDKQIERMKDANDRMQERTMQLEDALTKLEYRLHESRRNEDLQSYLIDGLKARLAEARIQRDAALREARNWKGLYEAERTAD